MTKESDSAQSPDGVGEHMDIRQAELLKGYRIAIIDNVLMKLNEEMSVEKLVKGLERKSAYHYWLKMQDY